MMDPNNTASETMNPEIRETAIDAILAAEEPLVPSSGFLASVMERVREESMAPAPIPFPWKRAIPGFVLIVAVFGWVVVEFVRHGLPAVWALAPPAISAALAQTIEQAGWVALALLASLLSWLFSRRLAGPSGLL